MKQLIILSVFFMLITTMQAQVIKPKKVLITQKKMEAVKVEKKVNPSFKNKYLTMKPAARKNNFVRGGSKQK